MASDMLGSLYLKGDYIPLQLDDGENSCGAFLIIESPSRDQPSTISNNVRSILVIDEDGTRRWEDCEREDVQPNTVPGYGVDMFAAANHTDLPVSELRNDREFGGQSQTQTS